MDNKEYPHESEVAIEDISLDRTATIGVDNYHGFTLKTALVSLVLLRSVLNEVAKADCDEAVNLSAFSLLQSLVGAGAFARNVAATFGEEGQSVWLAQIVAIMTSAFGPPVSQAADYWGRKWFLIGGAVLGSVGCIIMSRGTSMGMVIAGQVIAALSFSTSPLARPMQLSLTLRDKLRQLDWIGYFLLSVGIMLFSMALSWSQNPYTWKNAHILATFIVGVLVLIALAFHQTIIKKNGLFHHDLFKKDRNFAIALACFFMEGLSFFAANGYYSFEISVLFETDPIRVGLRFSLVFISAAAFSLLVGIWSIGSKRLREPSVLAFLLYTLFNVEPALMASVTLQSSNAVWGYTVILGAGLGLCLSILVTAAQLSTPPALIAISTGLVISIRSVGGSVGLAIFTAIFNSEINKHLGADIASAVLALGLSPKVLPEFIAALASNNQRALMAIPGVTPQILGAGVHALQMAYLQSFRCLWIAAGAFSLFAAILSCFLVNPKKDMSMHVDAPLEKQE